MGFFDKLLGKPATPAPASSTHHGGINLSKEESKKKIDLRKHELGIILDKAGLGSHRARVALVLDFSYSMTGLYIDGTVQSVLERILPLGLKFDDNQAIDIFLFSNGTHAADIGELTEKNFYGFIQDVVMKKWKHLMGATDYAPIMDLIVKKYSTEPGDPAYVLFLTDGDNYDKPQAERAIKAAAKHPIFWQFVGVGHEKFAFLEKLDTMDGRVVDNANFFKVSHINTISDDELYKKMMGEFPEWIMKATKLGIIK